MDCPYCKSPNREGVRYCSNCGRQMPQGAANAVHSQSATATTATPAKINSSSIAIGVSLQGGRYLVKDVLGQGGMGAALLATDKRLDNKLVVIKELISEGTDPQKFRDDELNFKREVVTLAHLDHPLIPNVTDNFEESSRFFMVQEYVEGENLEDHMARLRQPMKERTVLIHAVEILDVLHYLSEQTPPIVHRDIKPANIIISSKDKRAHLVDFGIARADVARNARRKQTSALGTPGYAPPEQYQGNADPRSDLYALGATLHHLLTNRDPRDYPPFHFPPARTFNQQLSLEVEDLLQRTLSLDKNQRYQSAAAMKHDVEEILYTRFGVASGALGNYSTSGVNTAAIKAASPQLSLPVTPTVPSPPTPLPPIAQRAGHLAPLKPAVRSNHTRRNLVLALLVVVLLVGLGYGALKILTTSRATPGPTAHVTATVNPTTAAPTATPASTSSPIGVTKAADGEYLGISDGTFAFDTTGLADAALKQQAAAALKAGQASQATDLFTQAVSQQTNDAEALIYLEDQRVLANSSFHVTIVVATMLTGSDQGAIGVGFDDLQGAYVAQKNYNDNAVLNGIGVVLLVANAGSNASSAPAVAQQIVRAAKADSTIIGVMGWPYSSYVANTVDIFQTAHLPMVSSTASSDLLTGISPYFFRVCPTNKSEGIAAADYATNHLHAKNMIVFEDSLNAYTSSLAADFSTRYLADGGKILKKELYTVNNAASVEAALSDALTYTNPVPDTIYFAGYAQDLSVLMTSMAQKNSWPAVQIIGGDGLYELQGYQGPSRPVWNRVHFTAFAYPGVWDVLGLGSTKPAFFSDYASDFNPQNVSHTDPYGWTSADNDAMLAYDATDALLKAAQNTGKTLIQASDVALTLKQITGSQAIQGVSGQISFDTDGDALSKAVVFLNVSDQGEITMADNTVAGQFLLQH